MTLDEAIKLAEEVAERNEQRVESVRNRPITSADFYNEEELCSRCAEEHRQLGEWLKDYKRLLEQQPCDDCIGRQAAIDAIDALYLDGDSSASYRASAEGDALIGKYQAITALDDLPPVTPQPKMGKWKAFTHSAYRGKDEDDEPIWREVTVYHCDLCNRRTVIKEKYCPNCGGKMQEVEK